MMGQTMDEQGIMAKSHELMAQEGGVDSNNRIYEVNPEQWRKLKYFLTVDVEELLPLSLRQSFNQQQLQEQMMQGQGNPAPMASPKVA